MPGMDGTGTLFGAFASSLDARLRPRVVAYPTEEPRAYDELFDRLPVPEGDFAIVAESFSGPLGIRLAAAHPARVRALVLVATFATNPSRLARWMRPLLGERLFLRPLPDFTVRAGLLGGDATADDIAALRSAIAPVSPVVLAKRATEVIDVDVRDALAEVRAPLLYLAGARDRLVGRATRAELTRLRPDMEVEVLDSPHMVLQRRPIDAARIVSDFVVRHAP